MNKKIESIIHEYASMFGLDATDEKKIKKAYNKLNPAQKQDSQGWMNSMLNESNEGKREQSLALQGKKIY